VTMNNLSLRLLMK